VKPIQCGARITSGKLRVYSRRQFDKLIAALPDCECILTLEKAHATRSRPQNDYYFAVVVDRIAAKWKKPTKDAHELLKAQFLPHDLAAKGLNGTLINGLVIGGSTAKLNKLQFIEYLETIVGWAAEKWDLYIPDPDPLWRERAEEAAKKDAA
jgi:hypothetical protein